MYTVLFHFKKILNMLVILSESRFVIEKLKFIEQLKKVNKIYSRKNHIKQREFIIFNIIYTYNNNVHIYVCINILFILYS